MWFVYVLQSERNGRYYVGSRDNTARRLEEHNTGKTPATRYLVPWRIVYTQEFANRLEARQREMEIKRWKSRTYLERTLHLGGLLRL